MQNNYNDSEIEDKLLNNSLLFSSIRKNKTSDKKIEKIKKYLDRGADINATDANNKNNTPLHVAVMKGELDVVICLLNRGALVNNKNRDGQTALDVARLLDKSDDNTTIVFYLYTFKELQRSSQQKLETNLTSQSDLESSKVREDLKYLQPVACDSENPAQSSKVNNGGAVKSRKAVQNMSNQKQLNKQLKTAEEKEIFCYQKRTGTSGVSGQLYESKLLTLILFRALYVYEIKTFIIGTNVDHIGDFDDIVFRFCSNKDNIPRIIFVQTKHKCKPTKGKFTYEEIMKFDGNLSLHKFLESYIKISQKFVPESNDDMFKGEFKNMNCEFIIYTSAHEQFPKKKSVEKTEVQLLIATSNDDSDLDHQDQTKVDHVFQFDYDDQDLELLVQTVAKSRAVLLAKRLSNFIFNDNYSKMMRDDLIKTYHVFLARHILEVYIKDGESQSNFRNAQFRKSFFSSNDSLLLAFKATICKEVLKLKIMSEENLDKVESILMSSIFQVPVIFGNLHFSFGESEPEKGEQLEYLCSKFKQIFENSNVSENNVMKVDDKMVGPKKIFKSSDLGSDKLGGLVGNLLVFDYVTKTLKFNFDKETLSEDNLKLLEKLKSDVFIGIDLSRCRFDINVNRFPQLSLIHDESDKKLIKGFLDKVFFYTYQATEDNVEKILKEEIDKYFVGSLPRQNDAPFRLKGDAIFLKVHDLVQKWWKQPKTAPYLTESCKYFPEAEQDILNSPFLSILNFNYNKTIKNSWPALKFKDSALELLDLDDFFYGKAKILSIITEENALSSIKLIQYFEERKLKDYTFIDLDYIVIRNYFDDVRTEIQNRKSKINTLIVVCNSKDVITEIHLLIRHFAGKIIVISNRDLVNHINGIASGDIVERVDSPTGFKDLADSMRAMLLEQTYCRSRKAKSQPSSRALWKN